MAFRGSRNGSSVRRRMLARRLRLLREAAGLTLADAAPALDWSVSKLSRIEIAQVGVDVHGVRSMLDLYGAADQWTELVELAREANRRGWYRAYGVGDHSYIGYETEAVQVQEYAAGFVPGLLQVAEYAKALFLATPVRRSSAELEREIAVRMIRQRRLTAAEHELRLVAIVAEGVLRNPVGGPAVLRAQLEHLLIAAELDTVCLQVLPTAVGAHAALASGFYVLSFGDIGEPDMAYVEHALGAAHLEKEAEVSLARLKFDQLRSLALAPAESLVLVEGVLAES
ncbi:MAG: helix-turn-helix domain-containing protein [Pseudonocardia sp.]